MPYPEASLLRSFSQAEFDRFAHLSGDDNPIHCDPEFAARTYFGRTVAHGLLLCTVLRGVIEQLTPGARMIEQSVMFPAPTFTDEPMRFHARVANEVDSYTELDLSVARESDGEITCQGSCRVAS